MKPYFRTIDIGTSRPTRATGGGSGARAARRLAPVALVAIAVVAAATLLGVGELERALGLTFAMTWEITWALILGFTLSAAVQAVVSKGEMSRLLPDDRPRTIVLASLLGAASS